MTTWSARPRTIIVIAALVVLGVVLGVAGQIMSARADDNGDSAERNQLTSRATDFAVTYNTYDIADLADYQQRLEGLLTPAYNEQVVEITTAVFEALKDKDQKSGDAKVLGVAVDSIDDDSAEVLVAVDASITNTDNQAAVLRNFRWKVSFSKVDGDWLVSRFESVASVAAEATPATPTPTPTPTPTEGTETE